MKLISLIGEQPIPILLTSLFLEPTENLLVHTLRTQPVAERLQGLLPGCELLSVDAYELEDIRNRLATAVTPDKPFQFNLTGGTKMMSLAAYSLTSQHRKPFYYLKSETKENLLYTYSFDKKELRSCPPQKIPPLLNLSQYLFAHLTGYRETGPHQMNGKISSGGRFERTLASTLEKEFDEVMTGIRPEGVAEQVELDIIVRKGNQVGVLEVKTSASHHPKTGIDQLTTAAARKYLGAYTHRFYVVGNLPRDRRFQELARKNNIHVIFLPGYKAGRLPKNDARRLINRILEKMQPNRR